jgi:hypothetical protein
VQPSLYWPRPPPYRGFVITLRHTTQVTTALDDYRPVTETSI